MDKDVLSAVLTMIGEDGRKELERRSWEKADTDIVHHGTKIVLPKQPNPMSLEAARDAIDRKIDEENTMMSLCEQISGYPFDAAVAFVKAMKELYGWASLKPAKSFFDIMPELLTVKVGPRPDDTIQVPMGQFKLPGVENAIMVHIAADHGSGSRMIPALCIHAEVRKREQTLVMQLVAKAKEIMAADSIYKGKALRLKVEANGEINFGLEPLFLDTSAVKVDELVLSEVVQEQVETSLFTLIRHTEACERHGIPLKRGVLLAGKYGTGKTLTSRVTSRVCTDNGWTFIALDDAKGLKAALEFAKRYQPAVVFAEDIDRVSETRNDAANDLLNMIDGILTKDSKVICVLTTNHVEKINQAMLRPGRLDAVITVTPPDADAVQKLVRMYARGLIAVNEPLNRIGEFIAGQIPATIREVVERSKLSMVSKGRHQVIEEDLMVAAKGMMAHLELLDRPAAAPLTPQARLGEALSEIVSAHSKPADLSSLQRSIRDVASTLTDVAGNVEEIEARTNGPLSSIKSDTGTILKAIQLAEKRRAAKTPIA